MKAISRGSFLVFAMLLIAASASAQWTNIAPGLLGNEPECGAMQYRNGIVWAGYVGLWSSKDGGMTWQNVNSFPSDTVTDIAFYDDQTGLVSTLHSVYLTRNGGAGWFQLLHDQNNTFTKVSFNASPLIMHALIFDGLLYSSIDGGINWYSSNAGNQTRSLAVANDGTIYVFSSTDAINSLFSGAVIISSDLGKTWSAGGQVIDDDSYSFSVDSCDPNRLYLVNEQIQSPSADSIARLYLSTDAGATWHITAMHDNRSAPYSYFSGSMTTTKFGVFAGTVSSDGVLRSSDRGMTWVAIGGPANLPDSRCIAAIDENNIIAADPRGSIWLTRNSGGDSVTSTPTDSITFSPSTLFTTDTIQCDSIIRTVQAIRASCFSPYAGAAFIAGQDSASFSIASNKGDSISVILLPNSSGALNASLIVNLSNQKNDTIPLHGFSSATPYKYTFTPAALFTADTVQCDSVTRSVTISRLGCFGANPKQFAIAGQDSASFQIVSSDSDSVSIILLPNSYGALNASLVLNLSDGTNDSLPLSGYCKTAIWDYSYNPQNLFSEDSLWLCNQQVIDTILINASACKFPNVKSERISGADLGDYTLMQPITQPFSAFDTVIVTFMPSDTGPRAGVYQVLLSNGDTISIPLGGYGYPPQQLALKTINAATDTIGATDNVPIRIGGLERTENIDIVMHYDTRLEYENSFDMSGNKVDIPGQQWNGRSVLHFPNAIPGLQQGYSVFNVWSDTTGQPIVTFDSLTVLSLEAPCEYILPPPDTSVITPIAGCGIELLSKLVHLGQTPRFSVQPNPSTGDVTISCDYDIGDVTIAVYDMLGTERASVSATITQATPAHVLLPNASGVYYIRVISQAGIDNMNVVVSR